HRGGRARGELEDGPVLEVHRPPLAPPAHRHERVVRVAHAGPGGADVLIDLAGQQTEAGVVGGEVRAQTEPQVRPAVVHEFTDVVGVLTQPAPGGAHTAAA